MGGDALRLGRSGVVLATRHRHIGGSLRAQGLGEGDEHPRTLS